MTSLLDKLAALALQGRLSKDLMVELIQSLHNFDHRHDEVVCEALVNDDLLMYFLKLAGGTPQPIPRVGRQ